MSSPIYIGLDCGTSVIKAAAFDSAGQEIAVADAKVETSSPAPGRMEFDPEALWRQAAQALRQLSNKLGPRSTNIAALAITGAGNGITLANAEGKPLSSGILAVDNRAAELPDLSSRGRSIHGQCQWPGQTLTLLRWFLLNRPDLIPQIAKIFLIKDWVKWRLTGVYVSDPSEQSKVGLLDLAEGTASTRLLDLYGLAPISGALPPLQPSDSQIGIITSEASKLTGLPAGLPVANGLADIDASALGAGACEAGQLSVVAGTWSINQFFLDRPEYRTDIFGTSCHAVPGLWEELEASASSTANLTWFVAESCRDLEQRATALQTSVYKLIDEEVAEMAPCSTPVFFHPYLYGSNTDPNARAGFYGLAGWQKRKHLLMALFEGVVFSHALHVERLLHGGRTATEVRLSGGASRSRIWAQIFADTFGLPVMVPAVAEVGALGAALCAAVANKQFKDLSTAVAAMCRPGSRYEPDAALRTAYAQRYEVFKEITLLMKPVWTALKKGFPGI